MSPIFIAAAHKSSGKTSISIGLTAALTMLGKKVQTFKKGPDYIDPLWLTKASGRGCYNLDFNTQTDQEILSLCAHQLSTADIGIIEGNKGLYDGLDLKGSDSNAALAKLLAAPVILTIDTIGITRGIAPLLQGYLNFDKAVNIAGLILNKVGSSRHESKLIAAVEHYTDLSILGVIGYDQSLAIPERHLGLVTTNESADGNKVIDRLCSAVGKGIDLNKIMTIASSNKSSLFANAKASSAVHKSDKFNIKIGIARDAAFSFYYADDLDAFASAGAELVPFDALYDSQLPPVDGLFIGGGFPETQMAKLSANESMRSNIRDAINKGMPTYAECGGLMYLAQSISWHKNKYPMVGIIPGNIKVHKRPQGRGYVKLETTHSMPWSLSSGNKTNKIAAHEFHYASLNELPEGQRYAYDVKRGTGINGSQDGIVIKNSLSNFSHQRNTASNPWVEQFVDFVRKTSANRLNE